MGGNDLSGNEAGGSGAMHMRRFDWPKFDKTDTRKLSRAHESGTQNQGPCDLQTT